MFVHLHNHTYYSLLEGLGSPSDYAKVLKELGQTSFALTDSGVMYGGIEFYETMKKNDIHPILGCQVFVAARTRHDKEAQFDAKRTQLVLLAENNEGYENLLELTKHAHLEGMYYKPRVDEELLRKYSKGLIALSGGLSGEVTRAVLAGRPEEEILALIAKYQDIYGKENFFLELQDHPEVPEMTRMNEAFIELAKHKDIPMVVANNCYYARPEDREAHEILLCVQAGKDFDDPTRWSLRDGDYSVRSEKELKDAFPNLESAFENTVKIAERCQVEISFGKSLMPVFKVPEGDTDEKFLRKLCYEGVKKRFPEVFADLPLEVLINKKYDVAFPGVLQESSPEEIQAYVDSTNTEEKAKLLSQLSQEAKEVMDRLEYELCVIHQMGFDSYFLIVQDFIMWAKNHGIAVGPGRGSGAGSLVAYSLRITEVDPLKYALLFERFLNPARISMPDIDVDFDDTRREEVMQYVVEKYGSDHVAQVCTFGTLQAKQALKDVGRSLGIPYGEMDVFVKTINEKPGTKLKEIYENNQEFKEAIKKDPRYKRIVDLALKLEGVVRQISVHACAVIISDQPLTKYTALQYSPSDKKQGVITQYSAGPLEALGLLKMDFLGLRNLNILELSLKIIEETTGTRVDIEHIPLDDQKTFELFSHGDTMGIFQFESAGMRRYLKELKPSEFEDIVAMVALYRPGPLEWIPDYIAYKHKEKEVVYPHPHLEDILRVSYGIAIYQEQALQIARKFAGFSLGEADILRKAIGKKKPEEMMKQKQKFIDSAKKNGYTEKEAIFIFEKVIEPFAGYGFNRSHAVCYALISYQTAYLKAHYPTQFMAALVSTVEDVTDKLVIQIEDCDRMGIEVQPPCVNQSLVHFSVSGEKKLRFGLNAIKGFGLEAAMSIVAEREKHGPYTDLMDFITRTETKLLNKKSLEALTLSGAMDIFGDRKSLCASIDRIIECGKQQGKGGGNKDQMDIFGLMTEGAEKFQSIELIPMPKTTYLEKLRYEKEYLGFYLSGHPLEGLRTYFSQKARLLDRLSLKDVDKKRNVMGIITSMKKITTKKNDMMAALVLSDMTGSIPAVLFPKTYQKCGESLNVDDFVIVGGKVSERDGAVQLVIEELKKLDLGMIISRAKEQGMYNPKEKVRQGEKSEEETGEVVLRIKKMDEETLIKLKDYLGKQPEGDAPIFIQTEDGTRIKTPYTLAWQKNHEAELIEMGVIE